MKPACAVPVLDAKKRPAICGKPATTKRAVELPFCAECARRFNDIGPFVPVKLEPKVFARFEAMAASLTPPGLPPRREEAFQVAVALGVEAWEKGEQEALRLAEPEEGGRAMKPSKGTNSVSVRLDADTIARLDAVGDALLPRKGTSKRSTALRAALLAGLAAFEAERNPAPDDEGPPSTPRPT